MKFDTELLIYLSLSGCIILLLTIYSLYAQKRFIMLKGTGRIIELNRWNLRKELCYGGIGLVILIAFFITLVKN